MGIALAIAGALFIASQTLIPHPELAERASETPMWCVLCGDLWAIDATLNVILFMPLGLGLGLAGWSWRRAQLTACALTLAVETAQVFWIAGRDASLGDLLTNSLGGALGFWLAGCWGGFVLPGARASRRLAASAAALWVGLWALCGWLVLPDLPRSTWYAQVPPKDVYLENFRGIVLSAQLNGTPLRDGRLPDTQALRASLTQRGVDLETRAVLGPAPRFRAGLVSIFDQEEHEILALVQNGRALEFRLRARAAVFGLRTPAVQIARCLPPDGGELEPGREQAGEPGGPDALWAVASFRDGVLSLRSRAAGREARAEVRLSPSWGWLFLLPYEYGLGPEAPWLTGLWIAGLLAPVGYWTVRALAVRGGDWSSALPLLAPLLGLGAVPLVLNLPAVQLSEWTASGLGLALGAGLGVASLRLPTWECGGWARPAGEARFSVKGG